MSLIDITGWIQNFFGQVGEWLNSVAMIVMMILPDSPFQSLSQNATVAKYTGYLNYFIPISFCLGVLEAWLVAVGTFYLWQVILRWTKSIE